MEAAEKDLLFEQWFGQRIFSSDRDRELVKWSYHTLMGNVYTEECYLWSPFRCLSPGKKHFRGIWNWDSAFHAIGLSRWDAELAKESILGFIQFQREDGLFPDVICTDGRMISGFSKPPVLAWAATVIYERDGKKDFLEKTYPVFVKNMRYWEEHRSDRGLYHYDADDKSSEDYLLHVKYESGWDNSVRWDKGITEYYAIDLNCFMVMFYRALALMADVLKYSEEKALWQKKETALISRINETMWDEKNGYYADTNRLTGEVSDVLSPASFMPLYIGIASAARADAMRIVAEERFKGKMPTVTFDHPAYSNDYWRGPTWLNVAYFAAKGLKNYGFAVADTIKESILNMCFADKGGIYENYDSMTGKGLCCNHFSWSSVFILEFIFHF
ncbi:MAG: hypothetical protein IKD07_04770 [Clostridia bacterium]|nr:hypothetical protein [Clostridia bacterium]